MGIFNHTQGIKDVISESGKIADNLTESPEERQAALTTRHITDMRSDSRLSKMIRPFSLLVLLSVVCFMGIMSSFGYHSDPVILGELVILLGSAFGFYFESRKREKIAFKNAEINLALKQLEKKHEIKENRKDNRVQRRNMKRLNRNSKKNEMKKHIKYQKS